MHRVVVTGIGMVTPLGATAHESWRNMKIGISGVRALTKSEFNGLKCRIGGNAASFDTSLHLTDREAARWDQFAHFAVAAADMAVADARIRMEAISGRLTAGVIVGSSRGGIKTLSENAYRDASGRPVSSYLMPSSTPYMAAAAVAMKLGMRGPSLGVSTACASGAHAIGEAMRWIRHGEADIVVAGGADAALCRLAISGYDAARALSRRNDQPASASRPFEYGRDGFVISEGAGMLVLERLDYARERGARIHGEIIGYARTTDAEHETRPSSDGAAAAMRMALSDAGIPPEEVDFINAHATSTQLGDMAEASAIRAVFTGAKSRIPVTANKSALGHMLGATGAVEAGFTLLSLAEGVIPPTLNHRHADPDCALNIVEELLPVPESRIALSNSFGFGGANAVL
ncbi:MAG: beta-ketoacyl-[acyl-carrier-protein] synthase family protein, partial [Nitrospirae bacterium]|nr:beta-ketoacyl-[acyl-carrier-protein] synthase family protein [Nitrospirota bacterium]